MAYQNELTDIAMNELKAHGIRGQLRDTNGGHIEIAWQVVPEKEIRRVVVAKTTSDWRSRMNTRANVRKLLRADNVTLKMDDKPKRPQQQVLKKALAIPTETIPVPDQVAALRSEIGDLTELVMRLYKATTGMREVLTTYVPPPAVVAPAPTSSRSVKIAEYLSHDRWVNIDTLPRDTGLKPEQIKLKLQYLKNNDEIEIFRGQVRLKATATPKPKKIHWRVAKKAAEEAAKLNAKKSAKKQNGHKNGHVAPRQRKQPAAVTN